jgi:hypothetical protein
MIATLHADADALEQERYPCSLFPSAAGGDELRGCHAAAASSRRQL